MAPDWKLSPPSTNRPEAPRSIACGASDNLIERAADVTLKEGRSLILVVRRFLELELNYIGFIPFDPFVSKALKGQVPLVLKYPGAPASRHIMAIASRIYSILGSTKRTCHMDFFEKISLSLERSLGSEEEE